MDSTHLDLLTRDGKVSVTFWPALESSQYSELVDISSQAETTVELCAAVELAAKAWIREVEFD
jgi:hypothetical protein